MASQKPRQAVHRVSVTGLIDPKEIVFLKD